MLLNEQPEPTPRPWGWGRGHRLLSRPTGTFGCSAGMRWSRILMLQNSPSILRISNFLHTFSDPEWGGVCLLDRSGDTSRSTNCRSAVSSLWFTAFTTCSCLEPWLILRTFAVILAQGFFTILKCQQMALIPGTHPAPAALCLLCSLFTNWLVAPTAPSLSWFGLSCGYEMLGFCDNDVKPWDLDLISLCHM